MAVHAEHSLVAVGRVFDHIVHQNRKFLRLGVAHGVRQVDGGGPGIDGGLHDAAEEVLFRA